MAKIKFSALVSDMRNKLNGSVMSKNRYGSYMRNKTTPVNPQTTFQQNARARLAADSQAWGGLTEAQRNGWKALAQELPFTDIFGDPKTLTGNSLFCKLNGNLQKIGEATVQSAPLKVAVPGFEFINVTAVATAGVLSALNLSWAPFAIPAGFTAVVYATPGISPGVSFVKNQFRLVHTIAEGTAPIENMFISYADRFGTPAVGQKIYIRIVLVSMESGQQGIPQEALAFVV
jgi:hypothetical protein